MSHEQKLNEISSEEIEKLKQRYKTCKEIMDFHEDELQRTLVVLCAVDDEFCTEYYRELEKKLHVYKNKNNCI